MDKEYSNKLKLVIGDTVFVNGVSGIFSIVGILPVDQDIFGRDCFDFVLVQKISTPLYSVNGYRWSETDIEKINEGNISKVTYESALAKHKELLEAMCCLQNFVERTLP